MAPLIDRTLLSTRRRAIAGLVFALLLAAALTGDASRAHANGATQVRVERVKPEKLPYRTLRFLKENRDFIRARIDLLRQKPVDSRALAEAIDPQYLAYPQMLAKILSAKDSVAVADDGFRRKQLLASITELGQLEQQLDLMDRLLANQRTRLGILQEDFAGRQLTALVVVVSGDAGEAFPSEIAIRLEDGAKRSVPLGTEERQSLRQGGIVQVFHGFVEPRSQVVEIEIAGERFGAGDSGFITLDPTRDRLTFLRLDLSAVRPPQGAAGIRASTWLHDTKPHIDG